MFALPPKVIGDDVGDLRVKNLHRLQHCFRKEGRVRAAEKHPLVATTIQRLIVLTQCLNYARLRWVDLTCKQHEHSLAPI